MEMQLQQIDADAFNENDKFTNYITDIVRLVPESYAKWNTVVGIQVREIFSLSPQSNHCIPLCRHPSTKLAIGALSVWLSPPRVCLHQVRDEGLDSGHREASLECQRAAILGGAYRVDPTAPFANGRCVRCAVQ